MKYTTDAYIDWFLEQNRGDYRKAMAWLIGRMNAAEGVLQRVYEATYDSRVDDYTTIEYVELELDKREENK